MQQYFSNGKLLLTAEYVVLDSSLSLAIPTKYGQSLEIEPIDEQKLIWTSKDENNLVWFEDEFIYKNDQITTLLPHSVKPNRATHNALSDRLIQILKAAKELNPNFLNIKNGFKITTKLDFPKNWGLGASSTLINNLAQWTQVDAYSLLKKTFGGSAYDIACAQNNTPITYQILNTNNEISQDSQNNKNRAIAQAHFNPSFKDHLYFVHLNRKQNSRNAIKHYNKEKQNFSTTISQISDITAKIITCNSLEAFEVLITQHEQIIAKLIKQTPIKKVLFNNFNGCIKSLGAWGGDFILATSTKNPSTYFQNKGYNTIIPYKAMILDTGKPIENFKL